MVMMRVEVPVLIGFNGNFRNMGSPLWTPIYHKPDLEDPPGTHEFGKKKKKKKKKKNTHTHTYCSPTTLNLQVHVSSVLFGDYIVPNMD